MPRTSYAKKILWKKIPLPFHGQSVHKFLIMWHLKINKDTIQICKTITHRTFLVLATVQLMKSNSFIINLIKLYFQSHQTFLSFFATINMTNKSYFFFKLPHWHVHQCLFLFFPPNLSYCWRTKNCRQLFPAIQILRVHPVLPEKGMKIIWKASNLPESLSTLYNVSKDSEFQNLDNSDQSNRYNPGTLGGHHLSCLQSVLSKKAILYRGQA
jgi:hypothetical protein